MTKSPKAIKIPRKSPESRERIICLRLLAKIVRRHEAADMMNMKYGTATKYINLTEEQLSRRLGGRRPGAGRKKFTSDYFDDVLKTYIKVLRKLNLVVHNATVSEAAKTLSKEPRLAATLQKKYNMTYSLSWAKKWCRRNHIVNRRITTNKVDLIPPNWRILGENMIKCIKYLKNFYNIEDDLILNSDETPICVETSSNYSMDIKGTTETSKISFNKEKDRLTFMLTIRASDGRHLKPYIMLKGKKVERLVTKDVLRKCSIHANKNAWMTIEETKEYIKDIILPYTKGRNAILIWDHFSTHINQSVIEYCLQNGIFIVLVPARATPVLQPLDVAVNRCLKLYLCKCLEQNRINQLFCNDVSKTITMVSPNRSDVINIVYNFISHDVSGKGGFRRIGFFEDYPIPSRFEDIDYEGVFITNKEYSLKRGNRNRKYLNILNALNDVEEKDEVKDILISYFEHNYVPEDIEDEDDEDYEENDEDEYDFDD